MNSDASSAGESGPANRTFADFRSKWIVELFIIFLLGSYLCDSVYSAEAFGHLAMGRWIAGHLAVPSIDIWTISGEGHVIRSCVWIFEFVLSWCETAMGEAGLILLKLLFFVCFATVCSRSYSTRSKSRFFGLGCAILVSSGVLFGMCLTARLAGIVFFAWSIELFYRTEQRPFTLKDIVVCVMLGTVYAGVHGSAPVVLVLMVFLALADRNDAVYCNEGTAGGRRLFLLIFAFSQFLTPYFGLQAVSVLRELGTALAVDFSLRNEAASVFDYPAAFLAILWMLIAYLWHCHPRTMRKGEFFVLFMLSMLGLSSKHYLPYALVFSGFVLSSLWGRDEGRGFGNLGRSFEKLKERLERLPAIGVLWVIFCLVFINVYKLSKVPMTTALLPQREIDYLLGNKLPYPVLHDAAIGPYLLYRFADAQGGPLRRVLWTPDTVSAVSGLARIESGLNTLQPGWQRVFSIFKPQSAVCRRQSALYEVLRRDPEWELMYEEGMPKSGHSERPAAPRSVISWAVFRRLNVE